jgi:cold shock CspA family protein
MNAKMSPSSPPDRRTGIIKNWNRDRGYGFVRAAVLNGDGTVTVINDRNVADTFLTAKQVRGAGFYDLNEGAVVEFDTAPDDRGRGRMMAVNVAVLRAA